MNDELYLYFQKILIVITCPSQRGRKLGEYAEAKQIVHSVASSYLASIDQKGVENGQLFIYEPDLQFKFLLMNFLWVLNSLGLNKERLPLVCIK